ncbi:MAG: hypothetical protein Ta2E_02220 [Mycoplasmoidaceae bacterium]|nr:MAG: hypothetical protein Ta2E_02220 [Mycoplasmoidaceae bacterium]
MTCDGVFAFKDIIDKDETRKFNIDFSKYEKN